MNETLEVYLNLDMDNEQENEELIRKIDDLLLSAGMNYSGIANMYLPVERKNRDTVVFCAEKLLRNADWLKGILSYISVGTLTNACSIKEIRTELMSDPSPEKIWYYEQYYQKTKKLPHAIVVDEDKQLTDGYISYLLAKKYNVHADVYERVAEQPLRKIVRGFHVKFSDGKWRKKSRKRYIWIYTLKAPVVPGDILMVNTKTEKDFICVDKIDYVAGKFCSKYKKSRKHLHIRMEEESTNYEK